MVTDGKESVLKRIAVVLFVILVLAACQDGKPQGVAEPGQKAPAFTLKDLDGRKVQLSDFSGKVVLLEFWATWCPPCRASIPDLVELDKKYKDQDFVLLAISVDEGVNVSDRLARFASDYGITYTVLVSDELTTSLYDVRGIPVMFLLDREHVISRKFTGFHPDMVNELSKEINGLLK